MWLLIIVVVALGALAINMAWVGWRYALDDRPEKLEVTTADGWTVVAWFRPAVERRFSVPVVLCHGLANNHAFMEFRGEQNLARALSAAGFDCFSVDLRGAGASRPPDELPTDATIDDHVRLDLPALVEAVLQRTGATRVAWVGHSLGGIVGLAAASTPLVERFAAMVTIGSPVFFAYRSQLRWLMRVVRAFSVWGSFDSTLVRLLAPFAGFVNPGRLLDTTANLRNVDGIAQRFLLANVFAPVWSGVIAQLERWSLTDTCASREGHLDYRAGIAALKTPTLVIGGTVDGLAPVEVTRKLFELVGSDQKSLALFGLAHGHQADYGHGDLVIGRHAHQEVYPVIAAFLHRTLPEVG